MNEPSIALWAKDQATTPVSVGAWCAEVTEKLEDAASRGAWMLVLPELAALQWGAAAPENERMPRRLGAWVAGHAGDALALLADAVERTGVALLPGTIPTRRADGEIVNRATVLLPGGRRVHQDKLCLTPMERERGWLPGDTLRPFRWHGVTWAVCTCLDIEQPALAGQLHAAGVEVILVPSKTVGRDGYHRVFSCARARAVELLALVAVVGTVGEAAYLPAPATNVSGAAVYMPSETALGDTGVLAESPGADRVPVAGGAMLVVPELPVSAIRRLRAGGARVWPGYWSADHVTLAETVDAGPRADAAE